MALDHNTLTKGNTMNNTTTNKLSEQSHEDAMNAIPSIESKTFFVMGNVCNEHNESYCSDCHRKLSIMHTMQEDAHELWKLRIALTSKILKAKKAVAELLGQDNALNQLHIILQDKINKL